MINQHLHHHPHQQLRKKTNQQQDINHHQQQQQQQKTAQMDQTKVNHHPTICLLFPRPICYRPVS